MALAWPVHDFLTPQRAEFSKPALVLSALGVGSPSRPCLPTAACSLTTGCSSPGIPRCYGAGEPPGAVFRQLVRGCGELGEWGARGGGAGALAEGGGEGVSLVPLAKRFRVPPRGLGALSAVQNCVCPTSPGLPEEELPSPAGAVGWKSSGHAVVGAAGDAKANGSVWLLFQHP